MIHPEFKQESERVYGPDIHHFDVTNIFYNFIGDVEPRLHESSILLRVDRIGIM